MCISAAYIPSAYIDYYFYSLTSKAKTRQSSKVEDDFSRTRRGVSATFLRFLRSVYYIACSKSLCIYIYTRGILDFQSISYYDIGPDAIREDLFEKFASASILSYFILCRTILITGSAARIDRIVGFDARILYRVHLHHHRIHPFYKNLLLYYKKKNISFNGFTYLLYFPRFSPIYTPTHFEYTLRRPIILYSHFCF